MKMVSFLLIVAVAFGICPIAAADNAETRAGYVATQMELREHIRTETVSYEAVKAQSRQTVLLLEGAIQEVERQLTEDYEAAQSARIAAEFLAAEAEATRAEGQEALDSMKKDQADARDNLQKVANQYEGIKIQSEDRILLLEGAIRVLDRQKAAAEKDVVEETVTEPTEEVTEETVEPKTE